MALDNIRAKLKRRISHKDPNPDYDADSADEETNVYVNKEVEDAEKDEVTYPAGRPGSLLNRMISHGNKKTEEQIAKEAAEVEAARKAQQAAAQRATT